jgi:epsilon-lactone hydrolase
VTGAVSARTVVALRGGGYCLGSLNSNRRFCELLGDVTSARVLNVGYRNAPEHRHPAALDDALAAYRWLLDTGVDPATVAVAGNSAGGGLALALLLALRDAGDVLPAAAVAVSPWTDLANTGASIVANAATEVMLDPVHIADTAAHYADADRLHDPYVSPLYGDLTGLPPLLIHASETELLRDDAVRLAERACAGGVDITLELVADMPHVWHLFAGLLPEADDAMLRIGIWLGKPLAAATS